MHDLLCNINLANVTINYYSRRIYLMRKSLLFITFISILFLQQTALGLTLHSPAFTVGGRIPVFFTCDGNDVPPPLVWDDVPLGTQSFVIIVDDPDAPNGVWTHWIAYNIPGSARGTDQSSMQMGVNSWGRAGYNGPCPPGHTEHRYSFRIYALDTLLPSASPNKDQILAMMQGHILAEGELMGKYLRVR
jgi:Raf kinase inhibitor-like YbhB/YbcL family protein